MGKRNRKGSDLRINHAAPGATDNDGLDALLDALGGVPTDLPESTDEAPEFSDDELEAIEGESIDEGETGEVIEDAPPAIEAGSEPALAGETPTETPVEAAPVTEPTKGKGKAKKLTDTEKAARKAEREAAAKKRAEEREAIKAAAPAPEKKPRTFFGKNNLGRMTAAMGEDKVRENMVYTLDEAAGDVKGATDANLAAFKELSVKVQRRSTYILEFAHRGGGKLNELIRRAFEVLAKDGKIVTGEKGNYAANLLTKPYDMDTVRSGGMNSVNAMRALKVVVPHDSEGHTFVLNPQSLIGAKVNELLGYSK